MGSKHVSKDRENQIGIDAKDMTASHKMDSFISITGYHNIDESGMSKISPAPSNIGVFRKRRQCPRAMQIALLFWFILGVFYWANQEAADALAATEMSDILRHQMASTEILVLRPQFAVIGAEEEHESIEMAIREKDEYLKEEEDKVWHIGYHYSAKDELSLNKDIKTASIALLPNSSLRYAVLSNKEETGQVDKKKKENSERMYQSYHFEVSSTMSTKQSSRAALICVIMIGQL